MRDNNGAILDLIRSGGAVSRVELAVRSGLTEASVSRIVKQLLIDGVIAETGRGESTGGKRPTLLELRGAARHAVGLLISETRVEYILTDLAGRIVASDETPGMAHQSRASLIRTAAEAVESLIADAGIDRSTVLGIGVAIPGRQELSGYASRLHPIDYTEWTWPQIEHDLGAATGRTIAIENDSTCAAIGEFWSSGAPTSRDFGVVNVSNGIGFGLVTAGDVYRGASANVGEIGHMVLDVNGPECVCGNRGCLETLASPPRIVARAVSDEAVARRLGLAGDPEQTWEDYETIAAGAAAGDDVAVGLVTDSATFLATALISLTNVLDLDRIVLTGPALDHVGPLVVRTVADEIARRAFVRNIHPTEVRLSGSGRHAAALGAATLVIHSTLGAIRRPRDLAIVV